MLPLAGKIPNVLFILGWLLTYETINETVSTTTIGIILYSGICKEEKPGLNGKTQEA